MKADAAEIHQRVILSIKISIYSYFIVVIINNNERLVVFSKVTSAIFPQIILLNGQPFYVVYNTFIT